jgi:hypothetical protein
MNDATIDDVLRPISGDLFPFPSPSIDIAQDWGWLHQNPLPAFLASSDLVGQIDSNNELPEFVGATLFLSRPSTDKLSNFV